MKYIIGTRGSKLAIAQTQQVIQMLKDANPNCTYDIKTITTKGDTDSRPLFAIDQRGVFERDVDQAVLNKSVHFAVHSMKDVPTNIPDGLVIASVPKRERVNDVLITKDQSDLKSMAKGSIVGTSSLRRAVQIQRRRPDIHVRPIRGNVETRIKRLGDGFDGIILAEAGIRRLVSLNVRYEVLPVNVLVPSPGQGALALIARSDDAKTIQMLESIQDLSSRLAIDAERALSSVVESGCRFPIGVYAYTGQNNITINVSAFSVDGRESISVSQTGKRDDPINLGINAGYHMKRQGVEKLALNWREKVEEWNKK